MHEPRVQQEVFRAATAVLPFLSLVFRGLWTKTKTKMKKKMTMLEMMQLTKKKKMKRRILLETKEEIIAI